MGVKDVHDQQLFVQWQTRLLRKRVLFGTFLWGVYCFDMFFWNWSLGKKAKPLVSIVLANAKCAGDFRLACHWNLYWRKMYWTLLLEKHVLDTSIGEESIGRPYNLYWRQLCWTTFIEHGSDSGVPFKFPKKPHSKPKGLLSGEHVTHTLKLDIACWHLKFICCLPFVKRRTSSQAP
jgi:hypothetical protein